MALFNGTHRDYYEDEDNFGSYEYIKMNDIIDNFQIAYVGDGKIIDKCSRTDIIFHARRGLQELSYDTLRSVESQEVELGPSLSIPKPHNYVNYVKLSWVDDSGLKRPIYPLRHTINPKHAILQDDDYGYLFGTEPENDGELLTGSSVIETRFNKEEALIGDNLDEITDSLGNNARFGIDPTLAQVNGWFTVNERDGTFSFSSDLVGKIVIIEYISDGLDINDLEAKIHKFAEEAIYMHIAYSILSVKKNIPEYIIMRFKKNRRNAINTAKIRLSNFKAEEMMLLMRGKSKQIKR
jgi:hypothetical protein